jgi:RNA polymerase sigma factor (sigma-70 family)
MDMRDDQAVVALVLRARVGDQAAWNEIVERYAPLLWSVCSRYGLSRDEAEDVGQTVWLRLVEHLAVIREPAALPGWLAVTTQRECLTVLRARHSRDNLVAAAEADATARTAPPVEEPMLIAERNAAIRAAFAELPPRCQQLLALLAHDPPLTYAEISGKLGLPIGGLGPRRGRCLDKLRQSQQLAALILADTGALEGGEGHDQPMVER